MDNGKPARTRLFYGYFVGMYKGWSLVVESFFALEPDDSLVRSNLYVDCSEIDYLTHKDQRTGPGFLPQPHRVGIGTDLPGFPTTLIAMGEEQYEEDQADDYFATNGYIVLCLGNRSRRSP
jgi:hypothetical protein